jgi:hypothetical protein
MRNEGGENQMSPRGQSATRATCQPLTRREIERRINELVAEVAIPAEAIHGSGAGVEGLRWIVPSDLVRRMRPHLVLN